MCADGAFGRPSGAAAHQQHGGIIGHERLARRRVARVAANHRRQVVIALGKPDAIALARLAKEREQRP